MSYREGSCSLRVRIGNCLFGGVEYEALLPISTVSISGIRLPAFCAVYRRDSTQFELPFTFNYRMVSFLRAHVVEASNVSINLANILQFFFICRL